MAQWSTALLVLGVTFAVRLPAQAPSPPPADLQRAGALFAQSDWKGALDAYTGIASRYPRHALSRLRIGVSLVGLGRFAEGEAAIRQSETLGAPVQQATWRLAQALAEQHKGDAAIAELQRSAGSGFMIGRPAIEGDAHFASLRSHPKWSSVLDAFDALIQPCRHDARFREFDFWVGDWDVRPTGTPATGPPARNTVTLEDNGCVVMEHWNAPGGSEGQSFNIYDRSHAQWRQTWVDNVGGQHDYAGGLVQGNMVYQGTTPAPGGAVGTVPTRLTFYHLGPDSVRQFSEVSNDGGKTWQPNYDLMYVRRKDGRGGALSDADRQAILALDSTFVRGWLADDTLAVLGVFSPDAVLLPPGSPPLTGTSAIRGYWWPTDGSHTRILSFERTVDEVGGAGDLAYLRGVGALRWRSGKPGTAEAEQSGRATDLIVYARDASGRWRVIRQMWNPLP
jgi:ketosteroid isomerase-like protein